MYLFHQNLKRIVLIPFINEMVVWGIFFSFFCTKFHFAKESRPFGKITIFDQVNPPQATIWHVRGFRTNQSGFLHFRYTSFVCQHRILIWYTKGSKIVFKGICVKYSLLCSLMILNQKPQPRLSSKCHKYFFVIVIT